MKRNLSLAITWSLTITGLVTLSFCGILLLLLEKLVLHPIRLLHQGALDMARGKFTPVLLKTEDELKTMALTFNDMAEKIQARTRKLEETLNHLQRAQAHLIESEKMTAVGQLAGGVAHEINNPLGAILIFAQGLLRRTKEDDPNTMPIKSIEREALRCKALVQNLLAFSRSNKTEEMEEINLNTAVEGALSLISVRTETGNIQLVKEFGEGLPKITASQNQIQQVVINLCNNAIDAMPNGGKLKIRTSPIQRNGFSWISLEVSDTGTGIPQEIQSKIFTPFFTTKDVGKGTGLGLSLVYEIVKKHKGEIELKSEVDQGTIFRVYLPTDHG